MLTNKKNMLVNLRNFYHSQNSCVFDTKVFPLTFLFNRRNYAHQLKLLEIYCMKDNEAIWIVKPGENSNQGQGITIEKDFNELKERVSQFVKFSE